MNQWKFGLVMGVLAFNMPLLAMARDAGNFDAVFRTGSVLLAVGGDVDIPLSRDDLFGLDEEKEKTTTPAQADPPQPRAESAAPNTKESLFDLPPQESEQVGQMKPHESREALFDAPATEPKLEEKSAGNADKLWHGFFQGEAARTYAGKAHWSKLTGRLEVGSRGRWDNGMQWKISGRVDHNAVFDTNNFYSSATRNDQQAEFQLRENYLDFSSGDWEYRLGRQHIVWGEMVGLFFADVVSAKDMREFVLQDFQLMRIPQWAARAEYFKEDYHAELIWIPAPSYDQIGKPLDTTTGKAGSEFFAYPASPGLPNVLGDLKPGNKLSNTNYGLRLSRLSNGWDMSGFLYSSIESSPTYYLVGKPLPGVYNYQGRHRRINQAGGTLAKDVGSFVFKAEAIYTGGRRYNVTVDDAINYPEGVVKQNTLDWVLGLDFNPGNDTRLNTQFFQRVHFEHDKNIIPDHLENGFSLLLNHKLTSNLEAEALLVRSLNRDDWMLRPKLSWGFERNWKLTFGLDVFGGPATGLFGQFDDKDRAYTELRYDF